LFSGEVNLRRRSFSSEGDGGGVTDNVHAEEGTPKLEGGASLFENVVEDIEAVVGIILEVGGSILPAGSSAVIDVSYGLGKSVGGEGIATLEEGIVERNLRKEAAEEILELNLTTADRVTHLSEDVKVSTIEKAVRVSIVDGQPQGNNLEWLDVHVEDGDVETHEVDVEANVRV
jgi:hypothetical protein